MSRPYWRRTAAPPPGPASLDDVLATHELSRRPARPPDHAAENRALVALAGALTGPPEAILSTLASLLLELCQVDSAGVSLLEEKDGREVFRWRAVAGALAPCAGGVVPRRSSPCGVVVDRDATLLFSHPTRHFVDASPPDLPIIVEALTVPFHDGDRPIGTVWIIAHTEARKLDAEDARLLSSMSRFAAAAVRMLLRARETERASEALRESEARHRFLAELAAATQPLVDPGELMAVVARMLAEHLGADRCAYAEVEDERVGVITGDHTRGGVPSIVGRWPVADFGPEYVRLMLANEPYVVSDVDVDPRAEEHLPAYRATTIRALVCVPLHKSGRFTAAMAVHQKEPRRWTPDEVRLIRLVVGRCWEAIERARAARSMRERDERLDYAVRLSGLGFWRCDLPFDEGMWDDRTKEHFWLPPDARVTIDAFFDRLHPDDREPTRRAIDVSIKTRTPYAMDYRTVDPASGAIKWIRALGGTTYAADGTPRRFDGVTVDITARKLDEERLARLYDQLREQDRRKDEFLATLAHELRNPLAPIRTGLEILKFAGGGDQGQRIRGMMERQVGHMVRMVDDLLDVSRITRGKVELRRQQIDLRAILDSALETSRPLIEAAGHELTVRVPPEPLPIDADPTRLAQVFANLLNNAAKYTPRGGRIELAARRDGGAVVVRVADSGVGIPADMLPRVFDMFIQVGRSIDRAQGGLGVGLTLVQRLIELHGGTVHAESDGPGRGSLFTVRLPLVALERAAPGPPSAGPATCGQAPAARVLVVDDSVDGAECMALLLEMSGHEVRAVHSGPEALDAARELGPDVVLLDIGLPGMNGYEVARRLRADPALAGLALVALTGWGTEGDRRQAREAGFDHHLTKPVDPAEVQQLVARIVEGRDLSR